MNENPRRQQLSKALEKLYRVFNAYREVTLQLSEPSCASDRDKLEFVRNRLVSTPFDDLGPRTLLDYYYLAIDHIGNSDDLRHFLPKLLDVMTGIDGDLLEPKHLPYLLQRAKMNDWPVKEREAIAEYARAAASEQALPRKVALQIASLSGF